MTTDAGALVCTCLRMDAHERMAVWRRRALPVVRRHLSRGRAVAGQAIMEVLDLVVGMDGGPQGAPAAFSRDNWHRSHHMPDCPCSNRRNPAATLSWGTHG